MRQRRERKRWKLRSLPYLCPALVFCSGIAGAADPLFGFTPFPYDLTRSAVEKTNELVAKHGEIYALHFDDGIPWAEALNNTPFPSKLRGDWDGKRAALSPGMPIYLGLSPLAKDRESLARASKGSSIPSSIHGAALDAESVKQAFYNYARRAVEMFDPQFVNLGIEAGELAERNPKRWEQFVRLYEYVHDRLKRDRPHLKIGISFGLQSLMDDDVARRGRLILGKCDYLGVSFYPFMSQFHEKLGSHKLPDPPRQWTEPLDWLREYSDLPLAICETGYTSQDVYVPKYGLHMVGDALLQSRYVRDLGRIAHRDNYSFVIWFLAIDYDKLYDKLPTGDGTNRIWRHIGLLDQNLNPKLAWSEWNKLVGVGLLDDVVASRPPAKSLFGFARESDLFGGSAYDTFTLVERNAGTDGPSMKWDYAYKKGRWQWGVREIERGALAGAARMRLRIRSDRPGPIFIQLEEVGGETHFLIVDASEQWKQVDVSLTELKIDPKKKRDGELRSEDVRRVLVADNAAQAREVQGRRTVWFADWRFDQSSSARD